MDDVAFAYCGNGSADKCFRRDVACGEAAGCAGEAAVGEQRDVRAEFGVGRDGGGDLQHLTHAGTALGAFVTNDKHVAGFDLSGLHGGETIFLVEDDEEVRSYVAGTLSELNYNIIQSGDAETAWRMLQEENIAVDLLLTDVVLPGKNGRELAEDLKKVRPGIKVLFMTGYSRNAIVHQGRLDPGVSLLQKPLTQAMLATKIREILDKP